MEDMDDTLATHMGIHEGDGLQTRCWRHCSCFAIDCTLCGGLVNTTGVSTTLFDGRKQLGDLCEACITAGPQGAAARAHRRAQVVREQADELDDLANALSPLDPARWSTLEDMRLEQQSWPQGGMLPLSRWAFNLSDEPV